MGGQPDLRPVGLFSFLAGSPSFRRAEIRPFSNGLIAANRAERGPNAAEQINAALCPVARVCHQDHQSGCRVPEHFLQLKPQNKRYGPTQAKALICEWEDGAVEVRYRGKRMDYEDLAVRPPVVQAAAGEARRELAKQVGSKPAQDHPWRQGYEQRMKLQRLNRSQMSSLLGVSASAAP